MARLRHRPITQTLHPRVIIELSAAALPHTVRAAFIQLAALPPDPLSFGIEAARVVADEQTIQVLVQHAMLERGRHQPLPDAPASWRTGRISATTPRSSAAQQRLAAWHLDLVRAASPDELAIWRQHSDNWQPLLQLWQRAADDAEQLRSSMQSVLPLLIDYGYWNDALAGLEHAISLHQRDKVLAPLARYYAGLLHYRRADFVQAQASTAEALEGFQAAQQTRSQVMALNLLGHIQKATGNYPAARESYEAARGLTPESDGRQYAACLTNLALLLQAYGRLYGCAPALQPGADDLRAGARADPP